jgi:hypothetical protein
VKNKVIKQFRMLLSTAISSDLSCRWAVGHLLDFQNLSIFNVFADGENILGFGHSSANLNCSRF